LAVRLGIIAMWRHHSPVGNEDWMTSIRLPGEEVLPAIRSISDELGLPGPCERLPDSRPLTAPVGS
jgi:hypothetical protein